MKPFKMEFGEDYCRLFGKPTLLVSGSMHYFRTMPEAWSDRLRKIKAAGCNCVETYIPWNLHEPEEGTFEFSGLADVEKFVRLAQETGLFVILRPAPFICAEWEFGGLPAWLLKDEMQLRVYDEKYVSKIAAYYDVLLPKLVPMQSTHGGPVIAMQIENEYGSYANDKKYLQFLKTAMEERGIDVPLFTSDGPTDEMLEFGTLPDVWKVVNLADGVEEAMEVLGRHQSKMPRMIGEFWPGWFDHWGEHHHTRPAANAAEVFETMLKNGVSVNFYMFHGGTNFGFYNGANTAEELYQPTVTSYDYDALLTECGDLTEKFDKVRETLDKYRDKHPIVYLSEQTFPVERASKKIAPERTALNLRADLWEQLCSPGARQSSHTVLPMEKYGQDYGFILYETVVNGSEGTCTLSVPGIADRAQVFVNRRFAGVVDRMSTPTLELSLKGGETTVSLLVENLGRINFGPHLKDPKGITKPVTLNGRELNDWSVVPLPMKDLSGLSFAADQTSPTKNHPCFYKGEFTVTEIGDTFMDMTGWVKGVVWVNGFNLGRYWEIGPAATLYVPKELLKKGRNEVVVLELHKAGETVGFCEQPKYIR